MKAPFFAALLLVAPLLAAGTSTAPNPVREFVHNDSFTDWSFDGGWGWTDGTLTHYAGAPGVAQPVTMPPITKGRIYRIKTRFSGRTQGSVAIVFGKGVFPYSANAAFTQSVAASSADTTFKIQTSPDYDGSISDIKVEELGDELMDTKNWTLPANWTASTHGFRHTPGSNASLAGEVPVVAGHTYQLTFHVASAPDGPPLPGNGYVTLGPRGFGWFSQQGGWNFEWDVVAAASNQLAFAPTESQDGSVGFNGILENLSLREVTSDPVDAPVPSTQP